MAPLAFALALDRRRWRSLVGIALLVGLGGAVSLAAVAGARCSATSLERFARATHEADVLVSIDGDDGPFRELLGGRLVVDALEARYTFVFPGGGDGPTALFAPLHGDLEVGQGRLLEGRRVDPTDPHEVVLFESTARQLDVEVGDVLPSPSLSPAQVERVLAGDEEAVTSLDGPVVPLRVVGIARNVGDLAVGTDRENATFLSPAFARRYRDEVGMAVANYFVDLRHGRADVAELGAELERRYPDSVPSMQPTETGPVEDSVAVVTRALWIFAAVVAIATIVWTGAAVSRHHHAAAVEVAVMQSLGLSVREGRLVLGAEVAPALLGGLVAGAIGAALLSPLLPVGLARRADPDPGFHVDGIVLGVGSVVLATVLAAVTWVAASRAVVAPAMERRPRPAHRAPSWTTRIDRLVRALPPSPRTGLRWALTAGGDRSADPRPALAGAVVAVVGLVAVGVVWSGTERLLVEPARWGVTWDVAVPQDALEPDAIAALAARPAVAAVARAVLDDQVAVDGHDTAAVVFDPVGGSIGPVLLDGRAPSGPDEVALGRDTLAAAHASMGSEVEVRSATQRARFRVVGVAVDPTDPIADGVTLTDAGARRLAVGDLDRADSGEHLVLVRWRSSAATAERLSVLEEFGLVDVAEEPASPPEVRRLHEVRGFPAALAVTLVVLGGIAIGQGLSSTVRRRRVELGVLSAVGFVAGQRRAVLAAQATCVAAAALVVGTPVGYVVGRGVWAAISGPLGVATDPSVPIVAFVIGGVAFIVAVNVLAVGPARAAGRLRVADSLRAE